MSSLALSPSPKMGSRFYIEPYSSSNGRHWLGLNETSSAGGPHPLPRTTSVAEVAKLIKEHVAISGLRDYEDARTSEEDLKKIKNKNVRRYYQKLNEQVNWRMFRI